MIKKTAELFFLAILCAFFIGCATSIKYQVGDEPGDFRSKIQIDDRRDAEQKKSKIMSSSLSNCWYGVYRIGDDQIVPDRLQVLAWKLEGKLGESAGNQRIIVKRYEIYNNIQKELRKVAIASAFGLAGYLLKDKIEAGGCSDAFALDKNPENKPSVIALIEVEYGGISVIEKIVQIAPDNEKGNDGRSENVKERIGLAVHLAASTVAETISDQDIPK